MLAASQRRHMFFARSVGRFLDGLIGRWVQATNCRRLCAFGRIPLVAALVASDVGQATPTADSLGLAPGAYIQDCGIFLGRCYTPITMPKSRSKRSEHATFMHSSGTTPRAVTEADATARMLPQERLIACILPSPQECCTCRTMRSSDD
jgi:hypothetical protein